MATRRVNVRAPGDLMRDRPGVLHDGAVDSNNRPSGQPEDFPGFVVQVVAGAGLIAVCALLTGKAADASGGSYADWLAALATLAAFVAAGIAVWYARRAFEIERRRELQVEDDRRMQQASRVAGWTRPLLAVTDVETKFNAIQIWLRNASDVPVTQVKFSIYVAYVLGNPGDPMLTALIHEQKVTVLPPAEAPQELTIVDGKSLSLAAEYWNLPVGHEPELRMRLEFQDASSTWWLRSTNGVLTVQAPRRTLTENPESASVHSHRAFEE